MLQRIDGGEGEIRTHGTREGSTVFETAAFDHSATSPLAGLLQFPTASRLLQSVPDESSLFRGSGDLHDADRQPVLEDDFVQAVLL